MEETQILVNMTQNAYFVCKRPNLVDDIQYRVALKQRC